MTDIRKMIPKVEAKIKQIDPDVIVGSAFYDDASNRLFITMFKGPRKIEITLTSRDLANGDLGKANQILENGVKRLEHTPIG